MHFTTSQEVIDLQNKEENLLLQFASRCKYNSAEKWSYISWVICLLSAFISIFNNDIFISILSFALDIAALIVTYIIGHLSNIAGDLRELFDSNTLGYPTEFTQIKIATLKEKAYKYINLSSYKESASNNGSDIPPGIRDWYEFNLELPALTTQKECLSQNIWWNKKMTINRIIITGVIGVLAIALFIIGVITCSGLSKVTVIGIAGTIIIKVIESLKNNLSYLRISYDIDVLFAHLETDLTTPLLINIQNNINRRRHLPVFEINLFHKKNAARLSALYRSTH